MHISKIEIKNFRLLRNTSLDVKKGLSLLIGKNNSGKTSLIVIFQKFFEDSKFTLDDYPLCQRQKILKITEETEDSDLAIQMVVEIKYDANDNLEYLSEFILDLDPSIDTVNVLFECSIDKLNLLKSISDKSNPDKERYISKNISKYTKNKLYVFQNESDLNWGDRKLVEKNMTILKEVINLQVIHAKRNVASSEESTRDKQALSSLTTKYYNDNSKSPESDFTSINQKMIEMDGVLEKEYASVFDGFLKNAKDFLNLKNLKVVSNIQSNELVSNSSQVVYGDDDHVLPEYLNGLGYMNILYLLLDIEIKKYNILKNKKSINLLFIEEPEAHTHPQMQYVFAKQIKKIIEDTKDLQTLITSHSSHIVSQCDFKDVRYLSKTNDENIVIKNFHDDLEKKYAEKQEHFKFLVQYLTLQSSELFFADKIIFIEGTTERILLPYFIKQFDEKFKHSNATPLVSQHISIQEVGANAKVFAPFLEFLGIKTLIITDIDSTKKTTTTGKDGNETTTYPASCVSDSDHTSNYSLKHFYDAPEYDDPGFSEWYKKLKGNSLFDPKSIVKVAYQIEEDGYHARSFEDAFLNVNREKLKPLIDNLRGLKHKEFFKDDSISTYELTKTTIDSKQKSAFASSLLYEALTNDDLDWEMPLYIKEALSLKILETERQRSEDF
ncbi:ATP-dependent endonuclease [Methylomonas sp. MO1]|uniref:ATP-dependent nuclease n=1 Tax=Methylomonas sp. MO1 TaxID=3073619 RepID=UPI0028A36B2A|nr:ATP-dependent endonuclease [Methylomonas sp. MO1]MDT4291718.1 ATP-dependent endonuclease [Methylomonas sp. MO1]